MSVIEDFRTEYDKIASVPPADDSILRPLDPAGKVCITVDLQEGKEPFMYSQAFVPCVVGQPIGGWCARGDDDPNMGFKCILMTRARNEVLRRYPSIPEKVYVKALRVVKKSQSGKALLCEVHEWE